MMDNLEKLHSFIEGSPFPDVTKRRLKNLLIMELSGRSQKDLRDFIAKEVSEEENGEQK